jgi:hypothetical protein
LAYPTASSNYHLLLLHRCSLLDIVGEFGRRHPVSNKMNGQSWDIGFSAKYSYTQSNQSQCVSKCTLITLRIYYKHNLIYPILLEELIQSHKSHQLSVASGFQNFFNSFISLPSIFAPLKFCSLSTRRVSRSWIFLIISRLRAREWFYWLIFSENSCVINAMDR